MSSHPPPSSRMPAASEPLQRLEGLEGLLNRVPVGFGLLDADLRYVWGNTLLNTLIGSPPDNLAGCPLDLIWPEPATVAATLVREALPGQEPSASFVLSAPADSHPQTRSWNGTFALLRSKTGDISGVGIALEPQRESSSPSASDWVGPDRPDAGTGSPFRLLARIAHELKNAQTPLLSAAQMLHRHGIEKPEIADWAVTMIERQVRRSSGMMNNLLDLARCSLGELELTLTPIALHPVLLRAIESVRRVADTEAGLLETDLPIKTLCVSGNAERLERALQELLGNAFKFTPPGGRIELAAALEKDVAVIRVKDSGIGMDAGMLEKAFEPFSSIGASEPGQGRGLGIGLALARSLIELHGGTLLARSPGIGRGTEFVVRIPAIPCPDAGAD